MIAWLLNPIAIGHDGVLSTLDLQFQESGDPIALSSWGVFSKEEDEWVWSCSEAFSDPPYPVFELGGGRWHIGGMNGISSTIDGCGAEPISIEDKWVSDLEWHENELWFTTATGMLQNGVYRLNSEGLAEIEFEPEYGSRLFDLYLIDEDGWASGVDGDTPKLWRRTSSLWENVQISTGGDFIDFLGTDEDGGALVQIHLSPTLHEIRQIDSNGIETKLFESPFRLSEAIIFEGNLILGGEEGHYVSKDHGLSWVGPIQRPETACLTTQNGWLYACSHSILDDAAIMKTKALGNPEEWQWEPVLRFGDVHRLKECAPESLVMQECPKVWEAARLNGGLDVQNEVKQANPKRCGCEGHDTAWFWLFPTLFMWRRRGA